MIAILAQAETSGEPTTLQKIWKFVQVQGGEFLINLGVALLIFWVGRYVARWIVRLVGIACRRGELDETLSRFLENLTYTLVMFFVLVAALDRLGISTTSLAAALAAAGLAIGLALQGSLSNIAGGIMIILFRPFKLGDYIEAGGTAGTVENIQMFQSVLATPDNVKIVVPNAQITSGIIVNYSANETRRIDLVIGCAYDDDLKAVKQFLEETIKADDRVLTDPAPVVAVAELGDNSVNFFVRPWVKGADYWPTRWDLTERIKLGFDERGFHIPFPQQDVHVRQVASA